MESFLFQATIYLGTAVIAVPISSRLGLGSVLGYLVAGILIGPSIFGLVGHEAQDLQHFAEFGVVMMLFLIGLELEPRTLWDMRHKLLGLGGLQIVATLILVAIGAHYLGQSWNAAFAIGMILSLSSTAIVLQTLNEKRLMRTSGGRASFAVLLTQDIAVIPMLAILPLLAFVPVLSTTKQTGDDQLDAAISVIAGLPGWGVTLVTLGAVAVVILAGIFLVGPLFRFIHTARLREMYTALALLIVVGIAFVMSLVGLSPALGTFLAGVMLANSEFRHELESDIQPFKGLLLGLFFITVGAGVDFDFFFSEPVLVLGLALGLMALKGLILFVLGYLFKLKRRNHWLFTLSLAQAGEFGFVLVSFSRQQNVLPTAMSQTLLLVIATTMLLTPLFFILYEFVSRKLVDRDDTPSHDEIDEQHPIIVVGVGRFGQVVNHLVRSSGFHTTVLDQDLDTIRLVRAFGGKGFFGDPTRPDLLHAAGLDTARVIVVAVDNPESAVQLVTYARKQRPDLHIIARATDRMQVFRLYRAGADDIVRETFDSSLRAGRYVLEHLGLTEFEAHEIETIFYQKDREAMAELAELWDPDIPITSNKAYLARAKELDHDMETAIMARHTRKPDKDDEVEAEG